MIDIGADLIRAYNDGYEQGKTDYGRPKGEWKTDMVYAGIEFYRCDQCEYRQSEKTRYCPNCGADCRGEGNVER